MKRLLPGLCLVVALVFVTTAVLVDQTPVLAEDVKVECPPLAKEPPELSRSEVYKATPYKPGESAQYEMRYMGALAGYGTLEVKQPEKYNGRWHRVFHGEAKTGDWYKLIFVGHDKIMALSQPWDFGIAKFYMEQDEGKLFGSRFRQKKWLEFDHKGCKAQERIWVPEKPEKNETVDFARGGIDSLGAAFYLRGLDYKVGKIERAPIYTSQKNWYLEANPIAMETVEVPAGKFEAVKLKLQTYIGKELQQKGDVYAWVATNVPERPIVAIQAEIKIGSVWLKLNQFKPGR